MNLKRWSVAVAAAALTVVVPATAQAASPSSKAAPLTFGLIGDIPYGTAQIDNFPNVISQINADPDVSLVVHLGDIKSGSSVCSNEYFDLVKSDFDLFEDPLVYTPGDNEWTDCHRANNGGYNPLERLDKIREVFFSTPNRTLGQRAMPVKSQADLGFPENVAFTRAGVSFAAIHVVGSNNSRLPWTGNAVPTAAQLAEVEARTAAALEAIHEAFRGNGNANKAVVLMMQADMFDPTVGSPVFSEWSGFQPIVQAIAEEASSFHGPVYLLDGDSHGFVRDNPLAPGSGWLAFYGVTAPAANLTPVTVEGSTGVDEWVKVTVNPGSAEVLWFERVPFAA